jgi:NAD(P)-dependent dehydrogenase (short-subunit alcohol dehydrogenase family)
MDTVPYDLRTDAELEATAEQIRDHGQDALTVRVDVSEAAEVEAAVEAAIDEFGRIDVLANHAGIESMADIVKLEEAMWDEVLATNLKGVWLCAKHVGKHFVKRGEGGKIVNTASVSGMTSISLANGHYNASKWGVRGLTKTLALELAEHDVTVNAVAPGAVQTLMLDGLLEAYGEELLEENGEAYSGPWNIFEPDDPAVDPQDITEAYMWLSSDAARYVTGITLPVDAGFTAK